MLAGTAPPQLFPPGPRRPLIQEFAYFPFQHVVSSIMGGPGSAFRHYVPERERHIDNGAGPQVVTAERLPFLEGGEQR